MAANPYSACEHTRRQKPDMTINKEIAEAIGREYRTLPIYEKGLFEHKYINHYSLKTNEYLACRWREYVRQFEYRVFAPFQFVDIRDYHFYNGDTRLIPSVSFHKNTDFRRKLKPGPGVDFRGQMPIPDELVMKRTSGTPRPEPLHRRRGKDLGAQAGRRKLHWV